MISFWPWLRWKAKSSAREQDRASARSASAINCVASAAVRASSSELRSRALPRPAIRWVDEGRLALRGMMFEADADAVCSFQEETYKLNFPDFQYTASFASAFRYDLRRATVDPDHGLFVLDNGRDAGIRNIAGFLWVVIAHNNWSGERYGYINNLYIVPARRGRGLGRELMKQGDEFFRSRGIRRVRLTVTSTNEAAIALYRACGYQVERWEMEKDL